MDLVQTVRKEGSRGNLAIGGNVDWSKIASDSQRENYLGHSVHAPVGRWQKGRDLNWYAKANKSAFHIDDEEKKQIEEEKRQIKEREAAMMDEMLGIKRPGPSNSSASNANLIPVGTREAQSIAKSTAAQTNASRGDYDDDLGAVGSSRGIGYGKRSGNMGGERDVLEGEGLDSHSADRDSHRHRSSRHHRRSHHEDRRDRSRDRHNRQHHRRSHRSRSRSREHRGRRYDEERPRERENRSRNYNEDRPRERESARSRHHIEERPRDRQEYGRRYCDEEHSRRNRNYNDRIRSRSPERPRRGHYDERPSGRGNRSHRHYDEQMRSPEEPPARREPSWSPKPTIVPLPKG